MTHRLTTLLAATLAAAPLLVAPVAAQAPHPGLPLKHAPRPTEPAITAADLMTRLYIFADDSMMGRQVGTEYNLKGTEYIAAEARRMGLEPAGDDGTYFQNLPLVRRQLASRSRLTAAGVELVPWTDVVPVDRGRPRRIAGAPVVFGGALGDSAGSIPYERMRGKVVVMTLPSDMGMVLPSNALWTRFVGAAAVVFTGVDQVFPTYVRYLRNGNLSWASQAGSSDTTEGPAMLVVTTAAAARLLGAPVAGAKPGDAGTSLDGEIAFESAPAPGRNVVAVLRGSDPRLAGQYVAIGAHNDHVGYTARPLDHDSVRAFNTVLRPEGAEGAPMAGTAEQKARVTAILDSLRRLSPPRADSVYNGADDDGSGSMGVLEIAEALSTARARPKRSVLFVWHTGEEMGMWGSEWFTDHPTVPRDSIVAQLNIDMIGRGGADDVPNGGPRYLQLIGSRRLSTEMGDLVERVNREGKYGFAFDYQFDTNGNPHQYYCRSDHYEYARYGIPITFFSTGGHRDYHMLTDEPQYIDYEHYAVVTRLIGDIATTIANLGHRLVVDGPKPDPRGQCRQ